LSSAAGGVFLAAHGGVILAQAPKTQTPETNRMDRWIRLPKRVGSLSIFFYKLLIYMYFYTYL
jgi:hypothetical protein